MGKQSDQLQANFEMYFSLFYIAIDNSINFSIFLRLKCSG